MTREEFLQGLKEALDGNMDASAIQENLNYYNEYINEEVRKGKTEQQVVDTLGDSWAIAQTLLEEDEKGADGGAAAGPRAVVPRGEGSDGQNGHWARRIFGQPVHRISPPERDGARKRQARGGRRDLRQRGHRQAQCACGFGCGALQRGGFEKRRGHEYRPFPRPERRRR